MYRYKLYIRCVSPGMHFDVLTINIITHNSTDQQNSTGIFLKFRKMYLGRVEAHLCHLKGEKVVGPKQKL